MRELRSAKQLITDFEKANLLVEELEVLLEFFKSNEIDEAELKRHFEVTINHFEELEFRNMQSEEGDNLSAVIQVTAGAGGTESCDWAYMLMRMYVMWAEKNKFKVKELDLQQGDVAGVKSVTIEIEGEYGFGWLKGENGVHRLVRISPFDSGARRHTSFASVWVYPAVDDDIDIKIDEKDLRIDTFRSSGAGGQHVNTTDSAVRITHLPTKIVVQCQNQRSQHKNKETCYKMLRARLYEYEIQKRDEENQKQVNSKTDIGWGHQIRSYVLQPYQLVKDLRNKTESTNPSSVLDGNIDQFIEEGIKSK